MFKFGKYAVPQGPYSQYREPLNMVRSSRNTIVSSSRRTKVLADGMGGGMGGGMQGAGVNPGRGFDQFSANPYGGPGGNNGSGSAGGFNIDRYNPVFDQLEEGTILEDWIPRDGAGLDLLFRRIYLRDPVIGPGIDIMRNLPWSDFSLAGIEDKAILKIYEDTMDALQIPLLMPDITGDHLVIGRNIISLIFDERKGIFSGVVPHDPDFIRVSPLPVFGFDPLCDFKLSPGFRKFLLSTDPRAVDARRSLPAAFLQAAQSNQGFLPLDPVSTVYLARKASQHDQVGTSLLTRCLYFWAIEKALLNAQMSSTRRRARSFVHLMAGIDNVWEPTPEELDALAGMIIQANEDPVGGVVATRTGVTINEPVGGGADFYKWSDELDLFSKYKMQAIGISEALLSGDACMVGSTLIPTEKGLVRIDALGNKEGPEWQDLDIKVAGRYKAEKAARWLYNGYKDTLLIKTQQGNEIQCTTNHPLLVLTEDGITEWKRAEHLVEGDILCISSKKYVREIPVESLNLPAFVAKPHSNEKEVLKPEYMTTDLAFLLGIINAEGTIYRNQIRIPNTNEALLNKCSEIFKNIFEVESQQYVNFDPEVDFNEKRWSRKKSWELVVSSVAIVHWLECLGVCEEGEDIKPAYRKKVPDSILQGTEDIWLSYLAGFIEGDGCFSKKLNLKSFSPTNIKQMSCMLNAMGYIPKIYPQCIELNVKDARDFYIKCEPYLVSKKPKDEQVGNKARNRFGIPWDHWKNFINSRFVSFCNKGSYFINDKGEKILLSKASSWKNLVGSEKRLLYDRFEKGLYSEMLQALRQISETEFLKLSNLLECRYQFTEIESIEEAGKEHVYDISMSDGVEPAFVANGVVVHNTYNNQEQARSVFVENLANLRYRIVQKMFYQNLFPTLARLHGFVKRTKAEIDHNIRVDRSEISSRYPVWAKSEASRKLTTRRTQQVPISELIMPTINWAKQLKPNQDEKYLDILEKLKSNEYPVTLKQWAMAAGLNPDTIKQEADENQKLENYLKAVKEGTTEEAIEIPKGGGSEEELPPDVIVPEEEKPKEEKPKEKAPETPETPPEAEPKEAAPETAPKEEIPETITQSVQTLLDKVKPLGIEKLKGVL